jgi:sugar lactone lactonase YvrE
MARFFDLGSTRSAVATRLEAKPGDVGVHFHDPGGVRDLLAPNAMRVGEWVHLAVVMGQGQAQIIVNAITANAAQTTRTFSRIHDGEHNYLGKSQFDAEPLVHGRIDEMRVWATRRTPEQIRENMFRRLTGREEGLVGLWNFDDPADPGRDASPHGFHGQLKGGAQVVDSALPMRDEVRAAGVWGTVIDTDGRAVGRVNVRLERGGQLVASTVANTTGNYYFSLPASEESATLTARKDDLASQPIAVVLRAREEQEINLTLREIAALSGRVIARDENPLPSVVVQALALGEATGDSPKAGSAILATMSDEKGVYRFLNLPPGRYKLRAHVPGGFVEFEESRPVVVEEGQEVAGLDFRLTPFKKGRWKRFTQFDRLANDGIHCIFQASDGAIWFGTAGGASRFDGCESVNITHESGLPGRHVMAIQEAPAGVMWFGTDAGLCRYAARTPGQPMTTFTTANGLPDDMIYALARDHSGRLWVGTANGLARQDPTAEKNGGMPFAVRAIASEVGRLEGAVYSLLNDSRGGLWVGTEEEISLLPTETANWQSNLSLTAADGLATGAVTAIFEAADGALWIGTTDGVSRLESSIVSDALKDPSSLRNLSVTTLTVRDGLPDNFVHAIRQDPQGVMWFATGNPNARGRERGGLSRYDGKAFVNFTTADGLPTATVSDVSSMTMAPSGRPRATGRFVSFRMSARSFPDSTDWTSAWSLRSFRPLTARSGSSYIRSRRRGWRISMGGRSSKSPATTACPDRGQTRFIATPMDRCSSETGRRRWRDTFPALRHPMAGPGSMW